MTDTRQNEVNALAGTLSFSGGLTASIAFQHAGNLSPNGMGKATMYTLSATMTTAGYATGAKITNHDFTLYDATGAIMSGAVTLGYGTIPGAVVAGGFSLGKAGWDRMSQDFSHTTAKAVHQNGQHSLTQTFKTIGSKFVDGKRMDVIHVYEVNELNQRQQWTYTVENGQQEIDRLNDMWGHTNTSHCFKAGTKVLMADLTEKPIEQVTVGDQVMSFSGGREANLEPNPVTRLYKNSTDQWVELNYISAECDRRLTVTPEHVFLSVNNIFESISTIIKRGDNFLINHCGNKVRFNYKLLTSDGEDTYNFEVDENHTYVAEGLRVHNISGDFHYIGPAAFFDSHLTDKVDYFELRESHEGDPDGTTRIDRHDEAGNLRWGTSLVYEPGHQFEGDRWQAGGDWNGDGRLDSGDRAGHNADLYDAMAEDARRNGDDFRANNLQERADDYRSRASEGGARQEQGGDGFRTPQGRERGQAAMANAIGDEDDRAFSRPVILDLDGDGVELDISERAASFDYDGDSFREQTSWASADDGFLVVDLDANGNISASGGDGDIDQSRELAFAEWGPDGSTDLQGLAEAVDSRGNKIFDTNNDGLLTSADDVWASMKVWQDLDQDGDVDEGELRHLDDWGISQINLAYDDGSSFAETDDDLTVLGNTLHGLASFVMNGEVVEGGVGDVSLAYNELGWRYLETDTGYTIEFEGGDALQFWTLNSSMSANVDMATHELTGVTGDDRANVITAAGLNTGVIISGGAGNDSITGGEGDDIISGGTGGDTINAGDGNDVVFADGSDNIAAGHIKGGDGYDQLIVDSDVRLSLSNVADIGFEAIEAGRHADLLVGQDDDVGYYFSSGEGEDTLTTAGGADILSAGLGNDSLTSGDGSDRLLGGGGHDVLDAGDDSDVLHGGAGNDLLQGGAGNDIYYYSIGDGYDWIHDYAEREFLNTIPEPVTREPAAASSYSNVMTTGKSGSYTNDLRTGATSSSASAFDSIIDDIRDPQVDGGIDTLKFGHNVDLENVIFEIQANNAIVSFRDQGEHSSLTVMDIDTPTSEILAQQSGQGITIQDWTDQRSRIENFSFSDGTVLDVSRIENGLAGDEDANKLSGTGVGDWINAGAGNDELNGLAGRDVLIAASGNDTVSGGAGDDFIFAGDGDDIAFGDSGDDYIIAGSGNDQLQGDDGDDALAGEEGNDLILGGAGNDMLLGGIGNDTLKGGAGNDTYFFFRGDGHDLIEEGQSADTQAQIDALNAERPDMFESLQFTRSGSTATRSVSADDENWDVLQFGHSVDIYDVYFQQQNGDLIMGVRELDDAGDALELSQMSDIVTVKDWESDESRIEELRFGDGLGIDISDFELFSSGLDGNDSLNGSSGSDLLSGGGGDDTIIGAAGDDVLIGGLGADLVEGGDGLDDLFGGAGDDTLKGGDGEDHLLGAAGNDRLEGGAGDDVMTGGRGDDTLIGGLGNDTYVYNRGDGHDVIDESVFETDGVVEAGSEGYVSTLRSNGTSNAKFAMPSFSTVWINEERTGARVEAIDGGEDVLQFGAYISLDDLNLSMQQGDSIYQDDLLVELEPLSGDAVTDSVRLKNWDTQAFRVETLSLSNGFSVDLSKIATAYFGSSDSDHLEYDTSLTVYGIEASGWFSSGDGEDTISASNNDDIIIGGLGNDQLEGGLGADTYVYSRGHGRDTVSDEGNSTLASDDLNDAILFDAGISIEDLTLQRVGSDMRVIVRDQYETASTLADVDDVITIENWTNTDNRVELLQFVDGLDFDISAIEHTALGSESGQTGHYLTDVTSKQFTGQGHSNIAAMRAWVQTSEASSVSEDIPALSSGTMASNTTIRLEGKIWLNAGETYTFKESCDDFAYLNIDGQDILSDQSWNNHTTGEFTFTADGYYDFEFIAFNGVGPGVFDLQISTDGGVTFETMVIRENSDEDGVYHDGLSGTQDSDWIDGFDGNDIINALNGDDFIFGGSGDDTIDAGQGADIISGGDGNDVITSGDGNDVVTSGAGDDSVDAGSGNDLIMAGSGDDTLNGGAGNDLIVGDSGDDLIIASAGQDEIRFGYGDGNDRYQGNSSYNRSDVFVVEDGIEAESVWFEQRSDDLILRLHGTDDTFLFEDWYSNGQVQGFYAAGEWLAADRVNSLVDAMRPHVNDLNDGTTAYGIRLGETPDEVLEAIEAAWS